MCCLVPRTLTYLDHNSKKSILQVEKSGLYSIQDGDKETMEPVQPVQIDICESNTYKDTSVLSKVLKYVNKLIS